MGNHHEKFLTFLTGLIYGLGRKRRQTGTGQSPEPQTSLVFKLPDELILSTLSHVSPDPWLNGHNIWFSISYGTIADHYHKQRVEFLRPLSARCWAMRRRLLPWVLERLVFPQWSSELAFMIRVSEIVNASHANRFSPPAFMMISLTHIKTSFPLFVKCLESFPNLYTLSIVSVGDYITAPLKNALEGIELPQIKSLILPPAAYPLLQHCRNVEDVAFAVGRQTPSSSGFLGPLASNWDSKVKRLAIPLCRWADAPQSVVACSRLTELTIISYHKYDDQRAANSKLSELVVACKTLPDFDTLQIVHIPVVPSFLECWGGGEQIWRKRTRDMEDWVRDCLKEPGAGRREGEERKRIELRVFGFSPCHSSAEIGEYVV